MSAFLVGLITVVAFVLREIVRIGCIALSISIVYATYKPSRRGKICPVV
jgi:hypothetical protein